eukprot:14549888-Ditylum_brightwellii.AAC.1
MILYTNKGREREKQIKVRAEAKRARETQVLQMNSLKHTQPQVPVTPGITMVTYTPGTQVMTLVSASISNGENDQSGGTPTICEIMASQTKPREVNSSMTRLPAGVYMDQTGCQFQVNAMGHLQICNLEVEGNKELCSIDGGSNNGLAGAGMHLYEMAEHP